MENILGNIRDYQFNRTGIMPVSREEAIALFRARGCTTKYAADRLRWVRYHGPAIATFCLNPTTHHQEGAARYGYLYYRSDNRYVLIRE